MKKHLKIIIPTIILIGIAIAIVIVLYNNHKREEYYNHRVYLNREHETDELPDGSSVKNNKYGLSGPYEEDGCVIWNSIYFGNYYQKNDMKKEPIQWRVLATNGDRAFLLSEKALDCQKYNNKLKEVTWETCSLRKWLNNTFYDKAFSENEKGAIYTTKVKNKYYYHWSEPGKDTKDKVYLLSCVEHSNSLYGFCYDSVNRKMANLCIPTDYAKEKGCEFDENKEGGVDGQWINNEKYGACSWWARDPDENNTTATYYSHHDLMGGGRDVNQSGIGVRPVINIDLSSMTWKKGNEVKAVIDNDSINILGY